MRRTAVIALILVAMLLVPVQAGDVTAQQEQQEDPRQPNANNTTMYLFHDGYADAWSHFNPSDENSNAEGEFRGNFKIDVGGDWTNGDNNGPCNNDCENLTITIFRGGAEVWSNEFTGIQQGEQNVPFAFAVTEDHNEWDGRDDSPIIEVTMKVKGDRQQTTPITVSGQPAHFAIKLGTESRFEMPIDPISWEEGFEIVDDDMMDDMEDTPGFTLVAASAALGMALFVNQRRENVDEA